MMVWYSAKPKGMAGTGAPSLGSTVPSIQGFGFRHAELCATGNDGAVRPTGPPGGRAG